MYDEREETGSQPQAASCNLGHDARADRGAAPGRRFARGVGGRARGAAAVIVEAAVGAPLWELGVAYARP
jgi:hypothetical protein